MSLISQKLRAFIAVTQEGSVHAAARQLHLTQTAVTRRLAALEDDLETTLFVRSRRGMELTDAGLALQAYAREVLDLEGETLAKVIGAPAQGRIRIQGPSSVLRSRVIPSVREVLAATESLAVEFVLADTESGVNALKLGRADFVVIQASEVADEFDSKKLKPERYILVGPRAWEKRSLSAVVAEERIVDFDPTDQMTFRWLEAHGLRDKARRDRHFVNNTDALATLVSDGLAYSVLASEFAAPLIASGKICNLGGKRHYDYDLALAWYPRRHMPTHFRAIIAALK